MKKKELEIALEDKIFLTCELEKENNKMKLALLEFVSSCEAGTITIANTRLYDIVKKILKQ